MPILAREGTNILFIHVPKTGGTSIEHFARHFANVFLFNDFCIKGFPCTAQHWHGEILGRMFDSEDALSDVFMVVRHPVDRLISEYNYRVKDLSGRKRERLNFERWARQTLKNYRKNNFIYDNHIRPQNEFEVYDPKIFKFEDGFGEIEKFLKHKFGVKESYKFKRLNAVERNRTDISISDKLKNQIYEMYRSDFSRYDYKIL